jgi:hypothetical protein
MNPYLKYTGLGFQFAAYLLAGYYLGKYAGPFLGLSENAGIAIGMLVFLTGGLYKIIREILNQNP